MTSEMSEKIKAITSSVPSKWREKAKWRMDNRTWLDYAGQIALRVLCAMEEKGMDKNTLCEKIGTLPEELDLILQGGANLKLDTIGKLSEALEVELISFPFYRYMEPVQTMKRY